jgi:hypothetical protein
MNGHAAYLGLLLAALPMTGCAVVMNGPADKLTAKTNTPGARVYVDGFDATGHPVIVPNDRPHIILVRAQGYADRAVVINPKVKAAPIVLDVIFAVPSFLICPITDLVFNAWTAVDSPEKPIDLAQPVAVQRERPTYVVGSTAVPSRPGGAGSALTAPSRGRR